MPNDSARDTDGPGLLLSRVGACKLLGFMADRHEKAALKLFDRHVRPQLPRPISVGRVPFFARADLEARVEQQRDGRAPERRHSGKAAAPEMTAAELQMLQQPQRRRRSPTPPVPEREIPAWLRLRNRTPGSNK